MPDPIDPTGTGEPPAGDPPATPPASPPAETTLTQADVDRIVQERLGRERAKYADYDDLKKSAEKLAEIEAANLTELEKERARADAAETKAAEVDQRARKITLEAAVTTAAHKAGAIDAGDVLLLLPQDAVTIGDDGQVTGAEEAVKTLLESKPWLVGKTQGNADGGPRGNGAGPKQLSRDDLTTMTPEQIDQARKDGQLTALMTG